MNLTNWKSQIRKGLIEFCLLNIIDQKKEAYGIELMDGLKKANLEVSEGTIYPLLSRLVKENYLLPRWQTPESGHPRKYYKLNPLGIKTLEEMQWEWKKLNQSINQLSHASDQKKSRRDLTC